ncbi:unnamed protein product [Amoebophrya sp. A120]|nr:unnamed protein product [Amoebophrya sp. A120]|eukprot:GSA120T00010901001.1
MAVSFEDYVSLRQESLLLQAVSGLLQDQHASPQLEQFWRVLTKTIDKSTTVARAKQEDGQNESNRGDVEDKLEVATRKLEKYNEDRKLVAKVYDALVGAAEGAEADPGTAGKDLVGQNKIVPTTGASTTPLTLNHYDELVTAHLLVFTHEILPRILLEKYGRHLRMASGTSGSSSTAESKKKFPEQIFKKMNEKHFSTLTTIAQACCERVLPSTLSLAHHCKALVEGETGTSTRGLGKDGGETKILGNEGAEETKQESDAPPREKIDAFDDQNNPRILFEQRVLNALTVSCETLLFRMAYQCLNEYPDVTDDLFNHLLGLTEESISN